MSQALFRGPGEGKQALSGQMALAGRIPGLGFIVKAGATETLGAYSVFESILPSGFPGPKPHTHTAEEAWYVIEGTLKFDIGEDEFVAEAGSLVLAPRGARHSFSNVGAGPVAVSTSGVPWGRHARTPPNPK
jgi:mannose-6-phosphate isomerase-like protein (cupin superfamily)